MKLSSVAPYVKKIKNWPKQTRGTWDKYNLILPDGEEIPFYLETGWGMYGYFEYEGQYYKFPLADMPNKKTGLHWHIPNEGYIWDMRKAIQFRCGEPIEPASVKSKLVRKAEGFENYELELNVKATAHITVNEEYRYGKRAFYWTVSIDTKLDELWYRNGYDETRELAKQHADEAYSQAIEVLEGRRKFVDVKSTRK